MRDGAVGTAVKLKGNWHCFAVDSISYRNSLGTGHYNRVTHMDIETGVCTTEEYNYSGFLSPLNEEVGLHAQFETLLFQLTCENSACETAPLSSSRAICVNFDYQKVVEGNHAPDYGRRASQMTKPGLIVHPTEGTQNSLRLR